MGLAFALALCNLTAVKSNMMLSSLYAVQLGAGHVALGALFATYAVAPILLGVYAGRVADSAGVRLPMLAGSAGMLVALVLPSVVPGLPGLFASAALLGMAYIFYHVAVQAMVGALSTPETRVRNFANYSLVTTAPYFIGPLLTGFLIEHGGYAFSYAALAVLPLLAGVLVIAARAAIPSAHERGASKTPAAPFRELLRNRPLVYMAAISGLSLTSVDLFQFYAPVHAHEAGLTPATIGIVLSMYAVAAVAVRLFMHQLVQLCGGEERLLIIALAAGMLAYVAFPLFTSAWLLGALALLLGAGLGCAQPLSLILTYSYAPEGRSAEGLGLRLMINNVAHLALPFGFGFVSSAFGLLVVFWANGAILAGSAALLAGPARARPRA
jgi:MFS family permease